MTLFIKIEDGACVGNPILEENFRQLFPTTSFPKYFTANSVEHLGYGIYDFTSPPTCGRYEKAVEVAPVRSENGIWLQSWQIIEMDDAEKSNADAEAKAFAIAQINQAFQEEIAVIKEGYTEDEIKSWDQQLAEAEAYQKDQAAQTPLLDAILTNRGGTKDELVLRIATNAMQYSDVFGKALGKKQKAIADLG